MESHQGPFLSSPFHRLGPILGPVFSATLGEALTDDICFVDYHPRDAHVALRFGMSEASRPAELLGESAGAEVISVVDGFVNLKLRPAAISYTPGPYTDLAGSRVAVEHTSITPCYPINIATARSTVLGEQARRALILLGATTSARFWFEDDAHQRELVRLPVSEDSPLSCGKADHVLGRYFVDGLMEAPEAPTDNLIATSSSFFLVDEAGRERLPATTRAVRAADDKLVAEAYAESLRQMGATVNAFDLQSTVWDWAVRSGTASELNRAARNHDARDSDTMLQAPKYVVRNAAYYLYLLDQFDTVISVVPHRHQFLISRARELIEIVCPGANRSVTVHYYGDVTIDDEFDSIRRGRFHTVDEHFRSPSSDYAGFWKQVLSRRPSVSLDYVAEPVSSDGVCALSVPSDPSAAGLLLVDELPRLLRAGLVSGRWGKVLEWIRTVEELHRETTSPPRPLLDALQLAKRLACLQDDTHTSCSLLHERPQP